MKYFIFISILILTPALAFAQVKTFQNLPGLENASNLTTDQYINALYTIAIVAASILAVFKLMGAGVKYMLSEVVTNKQKAKDDIKGALLGLLIILAAVTILNTINPNLTNLNFLRNASAIVPVTGGSSSSGSTEQQQESGAPVIQNGSCPSGQAYRCGMSGTNAVCRCIQLLN